MRFKDRVVVITGAGSGIGRATALLFASEGARVAVADMNVEGGRETAELAEKAGGAGMFVETNVTRASDTEALIARVVDAWQRVDVLVNNAGITRDRLVLVLKEEDWDAVVDTHLKGTFLCTKAALKVMLKQKSGRIVNMASIMGQIGAPGQANYSAAKGGIIALTKAVAKEVASRGILVNAVAPGFIDTAMTQVLPDELRKQYLARIPLQRYGTPEDVARAVAFLASDDASYITGQVLNVDGGGLT